MKQRKASSALGGGIILFAVLLLLGSIVLETDYTPSSSKSRYLDQKKIATGEFPPDENYLFFMKETDIGKQRKVTESFPNIELGSKVEFRTVYLGNTLQLVSNPFTKNTHTTNIELDPKGTTQALLLYFSPKRISGDEELLVKVEGKTVLQTPARANNVPIRITNFPKNASRVKVSFELVKPHWYELFNWNKLEMQEFKVVEERQNKHNNARTFDFQIERDFLERVYLDLAISCEEIKEYSEAIEVKINGYIVSNSNPKCTSKYNKITADVPLNILNSEKNTIEMETEGFYKVAYSVNKLYFNDQDVYKFTINSFSDIIDVVMYGDFDRSVLDVRLNSQTISLKRDEVKSIIPYLRFGTNEIKFLNKPVEIDEFVIEKNEFLEYN